MYWGITAASLLAVTTIFAGALFVECTREMICRPTFTAWEPKTLTTMQQLADQVHTVEQKASHNPHLHFNIRAHAMPIKEAS